MIHELKTWPEYYDHLVTGRKTFELRRNDRGFREGDTLHLREWEPVSKNYTGREMHRVVTYMLSTNMHSDFVVMALSPLPRATEPEAEKPQSMADAAEMLWIVLANVSGGDWSKQTPEWQEAAARWRDNYFTSLRASSPPPPVSPNSTTTKS